MIKQDIFYRKWTYLILLVSFISAILAGYTQRALISEGSNFLFQMFSLQKPGGFYHFQRYVDFIFQIPSLVYLKFNHTNDISFPLVLANYSYALYPFFSLFISWFLLFKKNKLEYFIFPTISYALSSLSTHAYTGGIAGTVMAVFWPLILISFFYSINLISFIFIVLLSVALNYTYQSSIILFPLVLAALVQNINSTSNSKTQLKPLTLVFVSLLTLWNILRPFLSSYQWGTFSGKFSEMYNHFVLASLIYILFFALLVQIKNNIRLNFIILFLSVILFIYFIPYIWNDYNFWVYHSNARISSVPICFLIAFLFLFFSTKITQALQFKFKTFIFFITTVFLFGTIFDFISSIKTHAAITELNSVIKSSQQSCIILPDNEKINAIYDVLGNKGQLPWTSILLQRSYQPQKVLFATRSEYPNTNFCESIKHEPILIEPFTFNFLDHGYFDFSKILN